MTLLCGEGLLGKSRSRASKDTEGRGLPHRASTANEKGVPSFFFFFFCDAHRTLRLPSYQLSPSRRSHFRSPLVTKGRTGPFQTPTMTRGTSASSANGGTAKRVLLRSPAAATATTSLTSTMRRAGISALLPLLLLAASAPLAQAATGLSGWRSGILTNYGGPFDGKNPNEPSWGTSVVRRFPSNRSLLFQLLALIEMGHAAAAAAHQPLFSPLSLKIEKKKKKRARAASACSTRAPGPTGPSRLCRPKTRSSRPGP